MTQARDPGPLMIDFHSTRLDAEERELIQHPLVGGAILFSRNYESPGQLESMVQSLRAQRSNLLVSVDQEGGRVQRFRDGFTRLPPLAVLGDALDSQADEALPMAGDLAWLMASELRARGVDLSFAPVLDLRAGNEEVIGDRALHADPAAVVTLAQAYLAGLREAGMAGVGKHYPGHGSVRGDSHTELPVDERDFDTIWAHDLYPYRKLLESGELAAVMTAHVVYTQFDPRPASFSVRWIGEILRQRIGFAGPVFCDDLSMVGATGFGDMRTRAMAALEAGVDILLVCNDRAGVIELLDGLDWRSDSRFRDCMARLRGRPVVADAANRRSRALQSLARLRQLKSAGEETA